VTATNPSHIARFARNAYNAIAREYNSPGHDTVRNFEAITRHWLERHLELSGRLPLPGSVAVDIGGGRGWLAQRWREAGYVSVLCDLAERMLWESRRTYGKDLLYCQLSAFALPFRRGCASLVSSTLCGAYLTPAVVQEVWSTLKCGGLYVLTETPLGWARATQPKRGMPTGKTWFTLSGGEQVLLPFLFLYELDDIARLLAGNGFRVLTAEYLSPDGALEVSAISEVNREAARALESPPKSIPILWAIIAEKTSEERV